MTIQQKRNRVIESLNTTLEKLKRLRNNQFSYEVYVTEDNGKCGTVCCVAGWYPKWFPESRFKWYKDWCGLELTYVNDNGTHQNVVDGISKFHKISFDLSGALFYGNDLYNYRKTEYIIDKIPLTASKQKVIQHWKEIISKIEVGELDDHLI